MQPDEADTERSAASHSQRALDLSREVQLIGWHTFHSWLDETGAPTKVQQELMRHASIQTTNVYGQAMSSSKRSEWKDRGDGVQADESERLKP